MPRPGPVATLSPMTTLVLTVVGDDRHGLVAAVADIVGEHGGNWENSELAELAGAFAGIVEISVPDAREAELRAALGRLEGMLSVTVHAGTPTAAAAGERRVTIRVLGNDRPGIVKDVSSTVAAQALSIERMTTETRDAAMAGGRLFEATIVAAVAASVDVDAVRSAVEALATDIQVDVALEV
ncbi:Formyltetrahydrofolate deformylase [Microbacterium lemovicicum]|uniref:Formyltetrahydrofolate deformylase n=2 Tax=Microbacterium lemovicicum TaxID=1072463 RepID=A0A3Q9IW18_9MICO|nr:Formyltetrahydrofolate deformylase [Microbacterium lemovicicum]